MATKAAVSDFLAQRIKVFQHRIRSWFVTG
jgi:hypothetical protein